MLLYQLCFFKKSKEGLCAADFDNRRQLDIINLFFMSSISSLTRFYYPLSDKPGSNYAELKMNNGDTFYIDEKSYDDLLPIMNKNNSIKTS